ncbi:hypothetical protein N2152v2_005449 [Parachlorella kessleri]
MARLALLLAACLAGPLLAAALDASVAFVKPDGSAAGIQEKVPLPAAGNCTGCLQLPSGGVQLRSYQAAGAGQPASVPVLLTVEGAPGGTAVIFYGFGSADCSGANETAIYTNFQTNSVEIDPSSKFPSTIQSLLMCVSTVTGSGR